MNVPGRIFLKSRNFIIPERDIEELAFLKTAIAMKYIKNKNKYKISIK